MRKIETARERVRDKKKSMRVNDREKESEIGIRVRREIYTESKSENSKEEKDIIISNIHCWT